MGEITIHNRGTNPIRVARFETTCPCVRVSPSSLDVKADETREITVQFDAAEEPEFRGGLAVIVKGLGSSDEVLFQTSVEMGVAGNASPTTEKDAR